MAIMTDQSTHPAPSDSGPRYPAPVAIGGLGGSGTRLIAALLQRFDYHIGSDLNAANDNLWFTLLFKRTELWAADHGEFIRTLDIFRTAMCGGQPLDEARSRWLEQLAAHNRLQHSADWLRQRVDSLQKACRQAPQADRCWGWKEPNTHWFLDRLQSALPNMKYIHVMRNGLDMAYSRNQNQLRNWGETMLGTPDYAITPYWSLKFWCHVHRRVISLGRNMPGRFLLLNYDAFCAAPLER